MIGSPPSRLRCLLACSLLLAMACGADETPRTHDIRVRVGAVAMDRTTDSPVLLLEEVDGNRILPIWIGASEARSIAVQLEKTAMPRPNSHDLAKHLLTGLDGELKRVVVTDLRGGTFYAVMLVSTEDKLLEIDSRPSDAIAIALRAEAPVFVRAHVFDASRGHAAFDGTASEHIEL